MAGYIELYQLACSNLSSVFLYTQRHWLWLLVPICLSSLSVAETTLKVSHDVFQVKIQKWCFTLLLVLSFAFNTVSIVFLKCHIHSLGLYDCCLNSCISNHSSITGLVFSPSSFTFQHKFSFPLWITSHRFTFRPEICALVNIEILPH